LLFSCLAAVSCFLVSYSTSTVCTCYPSLRAPRERGWAWHARIKRPRVSPGDTKVPRGSGAQSPAYPAVIRQSASREALWGRLAGSSGGSGPHKPLRLTSGRGCNHDIRTHSGSTEPKISHNSYPARELAGSRQRSSDPTSKTYHHFIQRAPPSKCFHAPQVFCIQVKAKERRA
jgi:hypothetical protein